jgi:4-diphosphocytidyl-2-C-methyl-D-erythritol kinase
MHVRRSGSAVTVLAPAKLNLFLEVLSRRADGFHEIESLMAPVSMWDTLTFEATSTEQISLTCQWSLPAPVGAAGAARAATGSIGRTAAADTCDGLPPGSENLALRAVRLLRSRADHGSAVQPCGARLHLVKRIPVAAGLGGGSSDAAAALVAANLGWGLGCSHEQLAVLAGELGSDVPFFLRRDYRRPGIHGSGTRGSEILAAGPAICRGRGERVEPVVPRSVLHCVVVKPPAGLSTAQVYAACRPAAAPRPLAALVDALRRGQTALAGRLLYNGLQPAAESRSPWIARLREEFSRLNFQGHQMSGSGTSYFGICQHARHARRLAAHLRQRGIGWAFAVAASC